MKIELPAQKEGENGATACRWRLRLGGAVQGVGFRPFVYRLASHLRLAGWVRNEAGEVTIEVEGPAERLGEFCRVLEKSAPAAAQIERVTAEAIPAVGASSFSVVRSQSSRSQQHSGVVPDSATCPSCLAELFDSNSRRFRYPFLSCAECGPRWSIVERQPYDRANTSMREFPLCADCLREYGDPQDRRFHAETQACPACGPTLCLWDAYGRTVAHGAEALALAGRALRAGEIVAVKGIGGFHLCVDARIEPAVARLRERKHREAKPFAVLVPNVEWVRRHCWLSPQEEQWLSSPVAPIVLLPRRSGAELFGEIAPSVAPDNPDLGVFLPYTPLHHLLVAEAGGPLVATSGNRSSEPICRSESEAVERLQGIADWFLVHNRRIVRVVEDSVVRLAQGRLLVLRRGRGLVPAAVRVPALGRKQPAMRVLALGAQLKTTVALSIGDVVQVSAHIGDGETAEARDAVKQVVQDILAFHRSPADVVACDLHPDFGSSRLAAQSGLPVAPVPHHLAHVLACMADNGIRPPALGVAWDGFGLGSDGSLWGGEFLLVGESAWQRVAHLRPFALAGGEAAMRDGRRVALALLAEAYGEGLWAERDLPVMQSLSGREREVFRALLRSSMLSPRSSSVGRLFDGVSALLGICARSRFEGEAAMRLEFAARAGSAEELYPLMLSDGADRELDWRPMVRAMVADLCAGSAVHDLARRFHATLAESIAGVVERHPGLPVVLAGGCFQNRLLLEGAVSRLACAGRQAVWPKSFPPNDGAIALGQVVAVRWGLAEPQAGAASVDASPPWIEMVPEASPDLEETVPFRQRIPDAQDGWAQPQWTGELGVEAPNILPQTGLESRQEPADR